MAEWRFSSTHS